MRNQAGPRANKIKTHCHRGHPLSGDNLRPRKNGRECRACRLQWQRDNRQKSYDYTNRKRASGQLKMGYLPSVVKLTDPGLLRYAIEMVAQTGRREAAFEIIGRERFTAILAYEPKLRKRVKKLTVRRLSPLIAAPSIIRATDDIMDVIESAVPRGLTPDHRADVIQNIWIAVLERRLKRSEIVPRVREYINAEYRNAHNKYGDRSLDVPIWLDSRTTLLDTLTRGLWD
jgi:hypothetical protein